MQTIINKKFSYHLNNYLLDLDLINKYHLTNVKKVPNLNQLNIELSLNAISNILDNPHKSELDSEIQIKTFFILYLLNSFSPSINFTNIKLFNKDISQKCYVKKNFSSRQSIDEIIVRLFNEHNLKQSFNKKNYKFSNFIIKKGKKKITFRIKFELNTFFDLEKMLNNINSFKKVYAFVNFEFNGKHVFKACNSQKKSTFFLTHFIQNILFRFHQKLL